jgi:hypothetical protein
MPAQPGSIAFSLFCRLAYWIPLALAIILLTVALFGNLLGLDQDLRWGGVRIMVLIAGLAVLGFALVDKGLHIADRILLQRVQHRNTLDRIKDQPRTTSPGQSMPIRIALALFLLFMVFFYLGMNTVWTLPPWPKSSYVYDSLAQAFTRGEVSLPIEPASDLEELDNPYDPAERAGIPVTGDLSYYDGRYFIYWGPSPAALSALWLLFGGSAISDNFIVFLSISAILIFGALSVLLVQREYFPRLPVWIIFAALLLVATTHPTLWTLNSPSIYTAAISSGQAFFIGGLFFMLSAITSEKPSTWRYFACGTFWALAVGSRLTLLVAVLPLVLFIVIVRIRAYFKNGKNRNELHPIVGMLIPLLLGAILLGGYNYARFENPFETGFAYQMVGDDQNSAMREGRVFNPRYVLSHSLNYLAAPIRIIPTFPFIRPWWHAYPPFSTFLARFDAPLKHGAQNAAGLLFVTPALLLGAFVVMNALSCPIGNIKNPLDRRSRSSSSLPLRWIVLSLFLSGGALALTVLLYRVSAMRFLMEVTPVFAILSAIGAFTLYESSRGLPARRIAVILLITLTITFSALIGFLLALNGADSRFDDVNPELYQFLVNVFSH